MEGHFLPSLWEGVFCTTINIPKGSRMRLSYLKKRLAFVVLTVVGVAAVLGFTARNSEANILAAANKDISNRTEQYRSCATNGSSTYHLIQVGNSNDSSPLLATDKVVVLDSPTTTFTVAMATGTGKCGTRDDGTGTADTNYATSSTYNGIFSMQLDSSGAYDARFPIAHFIKGTAPSPATQYETVALAQTSSTVPCSLVDTSTSATMYFYKACMNENTSVRKIALP